MILRRAVFFALEQLGEGGSRCHVSRPDRAEWDRRSYNVQRDRLWSALVVILHAALTRATAQ
jgi:hypothetical protein